MKLFVDDTRDCPWRGYECAYDYEGAIMLLNVFEFEFVSLDYSLGDCPNGLEILKYMHEHKKYPKHLNIHSNNIIGKEEMRRYAEKNFPDNVRITMNMLDK